MQHPGPFPDLLNSDLHFNLIPIRFLCPLKFEKHRAQLYIGLPGEGPGSHRGRMNCLKSQS